MFRIVMYTFTNDNIMRDYVSFLYYNDFALLHSF